MAATSTLKTILEQLVEETGVGEVLESVTGTTTTLTLTTTGASTLRGPFTGAKTPIGSPVLITSTTGTGEDTFVSNWSPSTGVLTVSPAITTGATDAVLIYGDSGIDHGDRLIEFVNRGLQNHCSRWQKVPLTFVPDGELLGTVASFWTASAGTVSYQSLGHPETVGQAVQISHSSAANATSNTIPCRPTEDWEFYTSIRATTDGDTATFTVRDVTNSADISVSYQEGSGTTTNRGFTGQMGTFTVPATCERIAFRIAVSGSGTMTAQMAPIIAFPKDARTFPFSNRVLHSRIGNFFRPERSGNPTGPEEKTYRPLLQAGRTASFSDDGDHLAVTFNFAPGIAYYDELVYGSALSAMTDTTVFPLDYVMKAAIYEMRKWQHSQEKTVRDPNGRALPSAYLPLARGAWKQLQNTDYQPDIVTVYGRR